MRGSKDTYAFSYLNKQNKCKEQFKNIQDTLYTKDERAALEPMTFCSLGKVLYQLSYQGKPKVYNTVHRGKVKGKGVFPKTADVGGVILAFL